MIIHDRDILCPRRFLITVGASFATRVRGTGAPGPAAEGRTVDRELSLPDDGVAGHEHVPDSGETAFEVLRVKVVLGC